MAEQLSAEELSQLQRELALERAAREELERQTVLKTRQLWQLRDQQDKEVQQYQEQLSVLRASLILTHKLQQQQQLQQHGGGNQHHNSLQSSPEPNKQPQTTEAAEPRRQSQDVSTQQEDASPTKADQRKLGSANKAQHTATASTDSPQKHKPSALDQQHQEQQQQEQEQESVQQAQPPRAQQAAAEQLLAAASKVQQLVEQLSGREPSAAADLSVLQWQLTAVYGSLTCADSGGSGGSTGGGSSTSTEATGGGACADAAACDSAGDAAVTGTAPATTPGTAAAGLRGGILLGVSCTGTDPLSTAQHANSARLSQQHQQQQHQQQDQQQQETYHEAARTAAAAQLFSGASNNTTSSSSSGGSGSRLVASNLAWYYLEPGEPPVIKGPYDAGLMLRWFLKGFLDNALRIAGCVVQSGSTGSCRSSSVQPECVDEFQPLGVLLQQVQQGQGYTPARPGKPQAQQPLTALARSSSVGAGRLAKQQQQALAAAVGGGYDVPGGAGGDGILAKSAGLLSDTVGYYLDLAASAQLPGSLSLVDILDKVIMGNVAQPAAPSSNNKV